MQNFKQNKGRLYDEKYYLFSYNKYTIKWQIVIGELILKG